MTINNPTVWTELTIFSLTIALTVVAIQLIRSQKLYSFWLIPALLPAASLLFVAWSSDWPQRVFRAWQERVSALHDLIHQLQNEHSWLVFILALLSFPVWFQLLVVKKYEDK